MMMNRIQSILGNTLGRQLCQGPPSIDDLLSLPQQLLAQPKSAKKAKVSDINITELPSDVLFVISDHLDAASAHALSLTCRTMYCAGLPKTQNKLEDSDRMTLLSTLERDSFGKGFYYCHKCNILHRYQQTWGPHAEAEAAGTKGLPVCQSRDRFGPTGNAYDIGYHHARLAMNAHLYGPEFGIPLENICITQEDRRQSTHVRSSTAAKITDNQLFILRSYSFVVPKNAVPEFRKCAGIRDFRLCEHLPFFRNASIYGQCVPELQRRPRKSASSSSGKQSENSFVPCTDSQGSCGLCMLDYDISIKLEAGAWHVDINAYHQLGDCRSPDEWMWARFTEKSRLNLFLPCRPNRRGTEHVAGTVKQRWVASVNDPVAYSSEAADHRHTL
jgi:hypothetical protein